MRTAVDTGTVQEYMACLSEKVRRLINAYDMEETREMICEAMKEYPDAAQPHNLLGILMETQGNHVSAMKHFRRPGCWIPPSFRQEKTWRISAAFPNREPLHTPWKTVGNREKKNALKLNMMKTAQAMW